MIQIRRTHVAELESVVALRWHWTTVDRGEQPPTTAEECGVEHVTVHTSADSPAMHLCNGFRTSSRLFFADSRLQER